MNTFGQKNGLLFYQLCQAGVRNILDLPDKLDIDPQIIPRSSLLYASTSEDVPALREEYENLAANGFDSEFWEEEKIAALYSFSKPAGLYSRGDAEANPYRTVHSLIAKAASNGVRVFEQSEAKHYEFTKDGVICHTENGRIIAKDVIFAMGYETQEFKKTGALS